MMASRLSQPPRTPPAWRSMSSLSGMLSSSSTVHGVFTCPLMQNSFVPGRAHTAVAASAHSATTTPALRPSLLLLCAGLIRDTAVVGHTA